MTSPKLMGLCAPLGLRIQTGKYAWSTPFKSFCTFMIPRFKMDVSVNQSSVFRQCILRNFILEIFKQIFSQNSFLYMGFSAKLEEFFHPSSNPNHKHWLKLRDIIIIFILKYLRGKNLNMGCNCFEGVRKKENLVLWRT